MKIRSMSVSFAVLAAAFAGTMIASGTASASTGGGCHTVSAGGDTVEGCVSASGGYVEPDGYIIANPGCAEVIVALVDDTTGLVDESMSASCSLGHKGPYAYKGINGHKYYSEVFTYANGHAIALAESPVETFSD